jgi:Rrf2 family protein
MLSRAAAIALRALVELAREPGLTLSVTELARRQQLPQPMLEQILLRLRRQGLVEARRGRHGGYRLARPADALPLAMVLQAVEPPRGDARAENGSGSLPDPGMESQPAVATDSLGASAGHRVEQQLRRRLQRLVQLELQRLTLAELLYDQRSWEASLGPEGGVMLS